jgi:hypothetical protein
MITRRQALAASAGALAAVRPAAALAATDRGPLSGLVAYQQAVVSEYAAALARAPLDARDRTTLRSFHGQAAGAAAALRKALEDEDGKPAGAADPASIPAPPDPSREGWLRDVIRVEELAVAAYYAALQTLEDERHLRGAAAFMAQSGRRLVALRDAVGEPLLPRAFETGGA